MVIELDTVDARANICDCEEGSWNIACELKFPICRIQYIYGLGKTDLTFKFSYLSREEREGLYVVENYVNGFGQVSFYDYKSKTYGIRDHLVATEIAPFVTVEFYVFWCFAAF